MVERLLMQCATESTCKSYSLQNRFMQWKFTDIRLHVTAESNKVDLDRIENMGRISGHGGCARGGYRLLLLLLEGGANMRRK